MTVAVGRRRRSAWLAAALLAVFLLKLGVLLQLHDHPLLQPGGGLDSDYYHRLAQRVAGGDLLLGPGLYFVSPLYIYFLGALLAAGSSLFAVKLVQIALGTAACWLVWLTARDWSGERAAWLALALAALTGVFTFYEVLILQAAIDPFLTALDLWLLTLGLRRASVRWAVLAGAVFALHALNRPNMLLVAGGLVLGLAASRAAGPRKALAFTLGAVLALTPLAVRNAAAAGTFTPVPSHGGLNLYIGNNPRADGTYRTVEGITPNIAGQAEDARRVAERAEGRRLTDSDVSTHFTRRAATWMREHPREAARLFVRKVAYTLNGLFLTLNYSYPFYRDESPVLRVLVVGPLVLVPLGLGGLLAFRVRGERPPAGHGVLALVFALLIVSVAIFFVASRYRLPLLVACCVTSGALIAAAPAALSSSRRRAAAAVGVLVLATATLAAWDFGLDDLRAEEELQMAIALIDRGQFDAAAEYIERAERASADPARLHLRIGQAYFEGRRYDEAVRHLEQAHAHGGRTARSTFDLAAAYARSGRHADAFRTLRALDGGPLTDPSNVLAVADLYMQIGLAFAKDGRYPEGIEALQQAVRLAPASATAHLNLAVAYAEVGRIADARDEARRALALNPSYQRAKALLAALGSR